MSLKPSDLLSRVPSPGELLEKPPLRALGERLNRSVVASGVRTFLDELKADLERRASDIQLPSLRELAERAARHVMLTQQPAVRPAINATGCFFHRDWQGVPLADAALERAVAYGGSFILDSKDSSPGDATDLLRRLSGAEAAMICSSYSGAVWLALAAIAPRKQVVIARGEMAQLEDESDLASIAASAAVELREVGGVNRTSASDYEAAINDETMAILRHPAEGFRIVGETSFVEHEKLVALARDRDLPLVELLGSAPLVDDLLPVLASHFPSVAGSISLGTQLAIARGEGLVGGPRCGILVGTRSLIHRIESHPMFAAWRAPPATVAALQATFALYGHPMQLQQTAPLFQLLSTSVENLRQRAERLAPQMVQGAGIDAAEPIPTENGLGLARGDCDKLPSYAIALTPANGDPRRLEARLRNAPLPIVGRRDGNRLILDLRTVLPRHDQRLIDTVAAPAESLAKSGEESTPPSSI